MPIGRPTKLTADCIDKVCAALEIGASTELAAQHAGIAYNTYNNWRKRGEEAINRLSPLTEERAQKMKERGKRMRAAKKEGVKFVEPKPPIPKYTDAERPFVEFFEETESASAAAGIGWLDVIDNAAASDPSWAARQLAWRYPEQYGTRRTQLEHTGKGGGPIKTETAQIHIYIPDNGRGDNLEEAEAVDE